MAIAVWVAEQTCGVAGTSSEGPGQAKDQIYVLGKGPGLAQALAFTVYLMLGVSREESGIKGGHSGLPKASFSSSELLGHLYLKFASPPRRKTGLLVWRLTEGLGSGGRRSGQSPWE